MYASSSVVFLSIVITCVRSHPGYWSSPSLNPVHGLYVKPSSDGKRGDLYVAATEENGVKSTWAVDQPVNFLPLPVATQPHTAAVPLPYPGFATPHDESSKRAVISNAISSPPVQYAYALPVPSGESNPIASYPYIYPFPSNPTESSTTKCDQSTASHYPFQFPFQFFYPQMMSAYSNAMTILKDAGLSEDTASSVMAHHLPSSPMWPPSSYGYPMYVMVDPSTWLQNQATTTPSTSTASPNKQEEESTQS